MAKSFEKWPLGRLWRTSEDSIEMDLGETWMELDYVQWMECSSTGNKPLLPRIPPLEHFGREFESPCVSRSLGDLMLLQLVWMSPSGRRAVNLVRPFYPEQLCYLWASSSIDGVVRWWACSSDNWVTNVENLWSMTGKQEVIIKMDEKYVNCHSLLLVTKSEE
jgi:hypothetical protein